MSRQIEALLLDDDIWSLRLIKGLLQECFPDMKVHARDLPDPQGEFDIYFVDNDFNGRRVLPDLARDIRRERPQALIIAFSATLDAGTLKELINAGCDGACDKSVYGDLARTMEIVRAYIELAARKRTARWARCATCFESGTAAWSVTSSEPASRSRPGQHNEPGDSL
jgi:DNA-binding NarL/FixJ family response regulator